MQCLDFHALLEDRKLVFLIGDEIAQYPIDFKARFGIDYSQYPLRRVGVREINRLIWHSQLSSHNGGDFFNEVFDDHPNLLVLPSIMMEDMNRQMAMLEDSMDRAKSLKDAFKIFHGWFPETVEEIYKMLDTVFPRWIVVNNIEELDLDYLQAVLQTRYDLVDDQEEFDLYRLRK